MHVVVTGKINDDGVTGSASSVIVKHRFKGEVVSKDLTAQTFTVLGQTIQVDDATVFKIGSGPKTTGVIGLTALRIGERVRINGIPGDNGTFLATHVKTKSISATENEIKGIITKVTPDIQIGTLTLFLDGQTTPVVGDCVEAEGTLIGNILTVKPGPSGFKQDDDCNGDSLSGSITKAEVEGVINGFTAADTFFNVGGQAVSLSASATFRPAGTSAADLVNGLKVEVEGSVTNGVLLATKVKIKKNGDPHRIVFRWRW